MRVTPTDLNEVLIIEPNVFGDPRGFFFESYNARRFHEAIGREVNFTQDNHSRSTRGVLRGLHYQLPPNAQAKLVRVVAGAIFDVAVDIRRSSPTFGKWVGVLLSAENQRQLWIPEGFAHGFLTLSESADVLYKASAYYSPADEGAVAWNDPDLAIEWPLTGGPILSAKDAAAPPLADT
ncbi:MAG: dTDP-4-dehydrorhamnose 3,5-epimerase [Pseudomonadota bacterium]|nr:dTDP-4-dehydrorhamnose 3,5-epimerase [Pseudomonadota bacterium]